MSEAIDAIRGHINQAPIPKAKCLLDERDRVNAMIDAIEVENAKLRELCTDLRFCKRNNCLKCSHGRFCDMHFDERYAELGIEVK